MQNQVCPFLNPFHARSTRLQRAASAQTPLFSDRSHCYRTAGTFLFNRLSLDAMQRPGEMVLNVSAAAQRLWTSTQRLEDVPPQHYVELCSMINRALRDDAPEVMPSLAVMVRGINVMCITRRKPSEQKLPPAMRTFRGGELPMQHVEFYTGFEWERSTGCPGIWRRRLALVHACDVSEQESTT
jgi:hypothetical protein